MEILCYDSTLLIITILQTDFAEASPKHILNMMQVKGLKISHIKSHLQVHIYSSCSLLIFDPTFN
jgi:SHAQKYF class myb-like DNA-binding protein